jgi:flagellar FliL protein
MAKGADKKDDDKDKGDVEVDAKQSGGKKKLILIIVAAVIGGLVLLGGTIGGTVYIMGKSSGKAKSAKKSSKAEDAAEEEAADDEAAADAEAADEGDGGDEEGGPKAATYVALDPAFVVNFEGAGPARFLQISVEVMTRKPEYAEHIKKHMPVIRNNLVLLFGSQTYDKVNTLQGKEQLRQSALTEVQKILDAETGDAGVEALYFTSFVMQ